MKKKKRISIYLLTVVGCVLILTNSCKKDETSVVGEVLLAEGTSPVWSPDGSKIAFSGSDGLYSISNTGKNKVKLATEVYSRAFWSPSGTYIIYTGYYSNLYRINADGSNKVNLTNNTVTASAPAWSPDGTKIAFVVSGIAGSVYIMNSDGSNIHKVTTLVSTVSPYQIPDWTSDGSTILFSAGYDSDRDIYFINSDGSNPRRVVLSTLYEEEAQLSSDGATIYFEASSSSNWNIYKVSSDGSGLTNLTGNTGINHSPRLSPDGSRIAFTSYRDGEDGLYVMATDGTNLQKLSSPGAGEPDWSPDGLRIAFSAYRNGALSIYSVPVPQ
jgi:Tol biopolymer transport system component